MLTLAGAGRAYLYALADRWGDENRTLADLTGWSPADIRRDMVAYWEARPTEEGCALIRIRHFGLSLRPAVVPYALAAPVALLCGCMVPPAAPILARRPPMPPILAEAGNLWPGPPARVPTLLELRVERVHAPKPVAARRRGGAGLCRATAGQAPVGQALGLCN